MLFGHGVSSIGPFPGFAIFSGSQQAPGKTGDRRLSIILGAAIQAEA
jgi:hypothetical protein